MAISYSTTTNYVLRYYDGGSDTSSAEVEQHFADAVDTALSLQVKKVAAVSTTPYVAAGVSVILVDATVGDITISLPAAAASTGYTYYIKKVDSTVNTVIIDANLSETIDGELTHVLIGQYELAVVFCDGSKWLLLN